jgi:hypothetical protein
MPRETSPAFIRQYLDLFTVLDGPVTVESFDNPAAADDNALVLTTDMKNGDYALALNAWADGFAHPVTVKRTVTNGAADTPGTITITGTDNEGATITEDLVPGADGVTVTGTKCFKTVTQAHAAGWVINGADEDTIILGQSALLGLGHAAGADADVLTVYDKTTLAATAAFTGKGNGTVAGSYFTPTGANGILDYTVVYRRAQASTLTANGAATLATSAALGFIAHVEEFGFRVRDALAGAGGTLTFDLCNAAGNVIAELTVTLAAGGAGAVIKTDTVDPAYTRITDLGTLVVKRKATGTAFTSGSGTFYARIAQRPQARI